MVRARMMRRQLPPQIALLLHNLDAAYDRAAWHGPNLKGAVRGLRVEQAVWRPGSRRHNIAEIVVHAAYWKYAVRRRLRGEKRGAFPLKGSNWFVLPARLTQAAWRDYVGLLDDEHAALREAIASLPVSRLNDTPAGSKVSHAALITGIAAHDVYHAGQVRLLRCLYKGG